jgi:hypothetical protein
MRALHPSGILAPLTIGERTKPVPIHERYPAELELRASGGHRARVAPGARPHRRRDRAGGPEAGRALRVAATRSRDTRPMPASAPRLTNDERKRMLELERENRDLRRPNEMAGSTGGRNELCELL